MGVCVCVWVCVGVWRKIGEGEEEIKGKRKGGWKERGKLGVKREKGRTREGGGKGGRKIELQCYHYTKSKGESAYANLCLGQMSGNSAD